MSFCYSDYSNTSYNTCADTMMFETDILDVGSEIFLVSPHGSIQKSKAKGDHFQLWSGADISFSAIPVDLAIEESRFFADVEYRAAVAYMEKMCADEIPEEIYHTNAKYRTAVQKVLSPRVAGKKDLNLKLDEMISCVGTLEKFQNANERSVSEEFSSFQLCKAKDTFKSSLLPRVSLSVSEYEEI